MKSRAILTGGTGFLGKEILKALQVTYEVVVIGRGGDAQIVLDLACSVSSDLPQAELVVHCAGKAHVVPRTKEEEAEFYQVNLEGTKHLCASIEASGFLPKRFVFISTVAVYGLDEGEMIAETHPLNGTTPYAKSKILAEAFLTEWCSAREIVLLILRLPLIAGPNPPGNLGAMIKGISAGRYLRIGKADAQKSIVWAADVAQLIAGFDGNSGVYNLTDGVHPSFRDLEICISTALGKKEPMWIPMVIARIIGKAGDMLGSRAPVNTDKLRKITSSLTFDDSKARKEIHWKSSGVIVQLATVI